MVTLYRLQLPEFVSLYQLSSNNHPLNLKHDTAAADSTLRGIGRREKGTGWCLKYHPLYPSGMTLRLIKPEVLNA